MAAGQAEEDAIGELPEVAANLEYAPRSLLYEKANK
jgi:hypothetical protein